MKRSRLFSQGTESESSSPSVTPSPVSRKENHEASQPQLESHVMVARIGEQLDTSFQVHELPTSDSISLSSVSAPTVSPFSSVSNNSRSDASVLYT